VHTTKIKKYEDLVEFVLYLFLYLDYAAFNGAPIRVYPRELQHRVVMHLGEVGYSHYVTNLAI